MRPRGFKMSETHKKNLSLSQKGRKLTPEHRLKLSNAHKGVKLGESHKQRIGEGGKGIKKPFSKKHIENLSKAHIGVQAKEKHYNWKGVITPINQVIRHSLEYKLWRTAVFERDNYTCVWCGARSGKGESVVLNADHIKRFADYPELRFAIDNGRTLCKPCHLTTDTLGRGKSKTL